MKANMFGRGNNAPAFKYIVSSAAYFSRKFSDSEIVVLKLTDKSHRAEVMDMCRSRAAKKKNKNAVVYADGVYVFLICCENSADIVNFIKRMN